MSPRPRHIHFIRELKQILKNDIKTQFQPTQICQYAHCFVKSARFKYPRAWTAGFSKTPASLCCLQFWGAMHVCMCMNVLNDIYVYAAYVDVVFHCTVARVTGYKARCECTIVITITYLRTGGVDAYRGIKVLLGGPFAHGHRVALRHLPCIGPHHVEPNHPLLEKKTRPTNQRRS